MSVRTGIGYDIHRTTAGRPLVLGGVKIESEFGLEGHSDADVLLHAVGDAVLGAIAMGDLGDHFPPGEAKWKDVSSLKLLRLIRSIVEGRGFHVVNVDATLICEEPQIAPYRKAMRANIGRALKIGVENVAVKATTNEALGAIGRGEGIAAMAVATVEET